MPLDSAGMLRRGFALPVALMLSVALAACQTTPGPFTFTTASLPDGTVGTAYEALVEISGNVTPPAQVTISNGKLPPGLGIRPLENEGAGGRISGVPEAAGDFTFTVYIACYGTQVSGQTGSREYSIRVNSAV